MVRAEADNTTTIPRSLLGPMTTSAAGHYSSWSARGGAGPIRVNRAGGTLKMGMAPPLRRPMSTDFTVIDAAGRPWTLSGHLDAAAVLVFLRGDF
jgi:hypothetical protein